MHKSDQAHVVAFTKVARLDKIQSVLVALNLGSTNFNKSFQSLVRLVPCAFLEITQRCRSWNLECLRLEINWSIGDEGVEFFDGRWCCDLSDERVRIRLRWAFGLAHHRPSDGFKYCKAALDIVNTFYVCWRSALRKWDATFGRVASSFGLPKVSECWWAIKVATTWAIASSSCKITSTRSKFSRRSDSYRRISCINLNQLWWHQNLPFHQQDRNLSSAQLTKSQVKAQ